MAIIRDGTSGTVETAAERNTRLQAAFDVASTTPKVPAPTSPIVPQTSIFGEPIDLSPEAPIGLSFADTPLGQAPYQDERQYTLPQFDPTQPAYDFTQDYRTQPTTTTSWTDRELDMLGGMSADAAIAWGARYTGQALFGDVDPRTEEFFPGAIDRETGEIINPDLMPSLLSPDFATALGISDEQRVMLGYNPEYPYELSAPTGGVAGGGTTAVVAGRGTTGGYSPFAGYGYSPDNPLIMWRIGF